MSDERRFFRGGRGSESIPFRFGALELFGPDLESAVPVKFQNRAKPLGARGLVGDGLQLLRAQGRQQRRATRIGIGEQRQSGIGIEYHARTVAGAVVRGRFSRQRQGASGKQPSCCHAGAARRRFFP